MSLRNEAKQIAESVVRDAAAKIIDGVIGGIERRLQWRWDNAPLLALEAEAMVMLLLSDPGFVWARKARIGHWRRRLRRFAAKAWAQDPTFADACHICQEVRR